MLRVNVLEGRSASPSEADMSVTDDGTRGFVPKRKRSYTTQELDEVASRVRMLLAAIHAGEISADIRTKARLEGAAATLEVLARGRSGA